MPVFFSLTLLSYSAKVESHSDYGPQGPEDERKTPPQEKGTGNLHSFKISFWVLITFLSPCNT